MHSPRRVVVAGGSGFLGRALSETLRRDGRDVIVLTRRSSAAGHDPAARQEPGIRLAHWVPDGTDGAWSAALDGAHAVVNLAGESIAGGRWNEARKRHLRDSRIASTSSLVAAIRACPTPPAVFISGSAVGYYGVRGDEELTEQAPPGDDFLARLCVEWEHAAQAAQGATRVVRIRTGLALDRDEGALPPMLTPFRFFVGGPIASGRQYLSWIHVEDWVALVRWAIENGQVEGAINATAPEPVTNARFSRILASVLHRPAAMRVPAFAVRALLGEMADPLVIGGQRAVPVRACELGFRFRYPELQPALAAVLGRSR